MIDVEFETPNEVDKLANFAAERIQGAKSRVLYIAFLFTNPVVWNALKKKIVEGLEVTVFAPPITSYGGRALPSAFRIYNEAATLSSQRSNFSFYVCPLWWQKDRSLGYLRSLIRVGYTLHVKLLVIDDFTYLPSSNFESKKHYDVCLYSDDTSLAEESYTFSDDLKEYSELQRTQSLVDMVKQATKITILSQVKEQKPYPFKSLLFVAPFYKYEPNNFLRLQIAELPNESEEFVDVMFQHFMPDVKPWSKPKSPSIMETLISKHEQGIDVRLLAASGVSNIAAIRAEDAPILQPLIDENRIRRSTRVHAKFMCTDKGFLVGSMNINPASLFQSYFDKKRKIDIDASLHVLLPESIPEEYEAEKYGTILESTGFKSSVEVLLIQKWSQENRHVKEKLRQFFNQCWSEV